MTNLRANSKSTLDVDHHILQHTSATTSATCCTTTATPQTDRRVFEHSTYRNGWPRFSKDSDHG